MNAGDRPGSWPYPRWIAHRGAGKLAPENTLAAFRVGAEHGYRMYECDAKLSADGVVFLLHDATLDRTTSGSGVAGEHDWATLSQLDAGGWHSHAFAGEALPTLAAVARHCQAHGHWLNIEIKPTPGTEAATGEAVARLAARLWAGAEVPPLLTSFKPEALAAAQVSVQTQADAQEATQTPQNSQPQPSQAAQADEDRDSAQVDAPLAQVAATLADPARRGAVVGSVMSGLLGGILLSRTLAGLVTAYGSWRAMFWCGSSGWKTRRVVSSCM